VSYVACGGSTIGESSKSGGGPGGNGNSGGSFGVGGNYLVANLVPIPDPCSSPNLNQISVGPSAPLELTNPEYDRTVRDLLGDTSSPSEEFPDDTTDIGFRRDPANSDPTRVAHYTKAAGDIADAAIGRLDAILPCSPQTSGEDACAAQFIATFGRRAFRRPLNADDVDSFHQAYVDARATGDFASGIRAVIFAALASPHFYQIEEKGSSSTPMLLGPHALASRLSYFIYRSMPDPELMAAADAGNLSTVDEVDVQTRRMLKNPRAHDGMTDFFREWLHLDSLMKMDKSPDLLENFASIRSSMVTETVTFAESIFFGSGLYSDLLTSSSTWADANIAAIYGEPFMGSGFQSLKLNAAQRGGLLTQPSILSITSGAEQPSPTLRGKFVREAILCQPVPAPPPGVQSTIGPVTPGVTNRQRYEMAVENQPVCVACHSMLDPIGYGFEEFDAVGRYRSMDNGLPVNASGHLVNVVGSDDAVFYGAVDLERGLATSPPAQDCMVIQLVRFALARTETDDDLCSLTAAQSALRDSGKMTDVVIAIAKSPPFRYARW